MRDAWPAEHPMTTGWESREASFSRTDVLRVGVWLFLATVTMLFAALSSALLVRRVGTDWRPVALPPIVWGNTAVLVATSLVAEYARRAGRAPSGRAQRWLVGVSGLGAAFLIGQMLAWRALAASGIGLATTPYGAFFYLLSGVHGAHLLGALGMTLYGAIRSGPESSAIDTDLRRALPELVAPFWHVLTALWLWVLLLLHVAS